MSAKYWIAKYVEDPLRNEPRNVGIFVLSGGELVARFIGERDDGVMDGRSLRGKFSHPNVYIQWRDYWRRQVAAGDLSEVHESATANYFVEFGGEVAETDADSAAEICRFLFDLLIGEGPLKAYGWLTEDSDTVELSSEITSELERYEVLAGEAQLLVRHPVVRQSPVTGLHVTHTPAFSQRNGLLYVFDHIDLSGSRPSKIKERAGLLGYMFSDIRALEHGAVAYSIVKPPADGDGEPLNYANSVLNSESRVVNWLNDAQRNEFLEERRRVASQL